MHVEVMFAVRSICVSVPLANATRNSASLETFVAPAGVTSVTTAVPTTTTPPAAMVNAPTRDDTRLRHEPTGALSPLSSLPPTGQPMTDGGAASGDAGEPRARRLQLVERREVVGGAPDRIERARTGFSFDSFHERLADL